SKLLPVRRRRSGRSLRSRYYSRCRSFRLQCATRHPPGNSKKARANRCALLWRSQLNSQSRSNLTSNFNVSGQPLANLSANQIDAHKIMTTLWNNDVGKTFRRLNELDMHRAHRSDVLINDRIKGATAFGNVAPQAANEPQVIRRIDKD